MSGGGEVPLGGEVDDIGTDLVGAHLGGMFFMMEKDVAADPVEAGFFGAVGVIPQGDAPRCLARRVSESWSSSFLVIRVDFWRVACIIEYIVCGFYVYWVEDV